ncbi:hypothetical protein [Ruegeria faecimaris]|uniref:hypothetical protein n=1 Tax=Ruegeria faecimaris TaxID=686389 RepID=UPI00232C47B5|nr:hypothetical protein [Ruegeria faecimaris]
MTRDRELFFIHSGHRDQIIEIHNFYVAQAKKRIMQPFTDASISSDADQAEKDAVESKSEVFHPDIHDESDLFEDAFHEGVWRYQLLTNLRDDMRLNIVAGFFHQWEKTLRDWLVVNLRHWHRGSKVHSELWKQNIGRIFDLLKSLGWDVRSEAYFHHLDACRLVVNVHKHGDGPSLQELDKLYPRYLKHPLISLSGHVSAKWMKPTHEHLSVSDADLDQFSDAIRQFWTDLPDRLVQISSTKLPQWFEDAIKADRKAVSV